MAAASVTPQIVKFGFKDYVVDDANKRTAVCSVCSIKISDTTTTTSNFIRHYKKTHRERCVNVLLARKLTLSLSYVRLGFKSIKHCKEKTKR